MKSIIRILGLVLALGLVSFTTVDAWPYYDYDNCYYICSDGKSETTYQAWTTYGECCNGTGANLWCPAGQTPQYPFGWGGTYTPLAAC